MPAAASSCRMPHEELTKFAETLAHPGHHHAHGPGRLSRATTLCGWACWACTAPMRQHGGHQTATCSSPWAPASTTGSPASSRDFAPHAKIIHIDIDPTSISKNVKVDVPIVGDCWTALRQLNDLVHELTPRRTGRQHAGPGWTQVAGWEKEHPLTYTWSDTVIKPQYVIEKLYELTKASHHHHRSGPEPDVGRPVLLDSTSPAFMTSGGLGTMGYGFPAAIGAQVAFPDASSSTSPATAASR